jgi:predicted NUDIX family NTP pyrophosphohydrolase
VPRPSARAKTSAGILLYRRGPAGVEVLLVHPGGPYFLKRELGAWSIPKGEVAPGEDALEAARREFEEETGRAPAGPFARLGAALQKGGKRVVAFAAEGDFDPASLRSNTFALEWPPRSGRVREFPEVDRAAWFGLAEARRFIHPAQLPLLDEVGRMVG